MDSGTPDPSQDLQAQLREVRAKRAALAAAKAARDTVSAQRELELEQTALAEEMLIERYETEIGPVGRKIAVIRSDAGTVIVRRPNRIVFKRFADKQSLKTEDLENLVNPCLLYPTSREAFGAMVDDLPALLQQCANACCTLAGVRTDELAAK